MTRDDVARMLRMMEHIGELLNEAESPRESRRLNSEYGRMAKSIRPYLTGKKPYAESKIPLDRASDSS